MSQDITQSSPETADLPQFAPGIVKIRNKKNRPALLGGQCPTCGKRYYPRPHMCPECLKDIDECEIGSGGVIYSFTVVRTKPPLGLPEPYGVAYVDLDESALRVFGLLDPQALDQFTIGKRVRLEVGKIGLNLQGEPCLRPYFTPDTTK
jgi:uncharacterized OB-fold protein